MEMESQHQIGVLNSYISFQLIDYLAERYEQHDECAMGFIQSFAKRKEWGAEDVMARLNNKQATLALLAGMIFFIKTNNGPLSNENAHNWLLSKEDAQELRKQITFKPNNKTNETNLTLAIQIIRNAIAHWGEETTGEETTGVKYISEPAATEFTAKAGALTLSDKGLHLLIMQMYKCAQKASIKPNPPRAD